MRKNGFVEIHIHFISAISGLQLPFPPNKNNVCCISHSKYVLLVYEHKDDLIYRHHINIILSQRISNLFYMVAYMLPYDI